jgi:hypothetical protein
MPSRSPLEAPEGDALKRANHRSIFKGRTLELVLDAVGRLYFARFEANAR